MIDANLEKGMVKVTGTTDMILTEYTVITRVVLNNLTEDHGEENAFKILAELGKIAAKDINDLGGDIRKIYDDIDEAYHDKI